MLDWLSPEIFSITETGPAWLVMINHASPAEAAVARMRKLPVRVLAWIAGEVAVHDISVSTEEGPDRLAEAPIANGEKITGVPETGLPNESVT